MSVVDLHPEELLDKAARGSLTPAESSRLEAHLARCAACRAEQLLRADFADELDGPEEERPSLTALLEGVALLREKSAPAEEERAAAPARPRGRRMAPVWFLVAAAMLAVSAATGATEAGKQVWTRVVAVVTTVDTVARTSAPAVPAPVAHATTAATAEPAAEPEPEALPPLEPIAPPAPVASTAPAVREVARVARAAPAATTAPLPDTEAAALFDAAAAARRHGDYAQAIALHRELLARFPRTREAQTSRATVGRLLLDRGDPSGALASFDGYMGWGSGELGEEAMSGRATALERLGRTDDARRAWEALLAAYPTTPYAAHARARIGAAGEASVP